MAKNDAYSNEKLQKNKAQFPNELTFKTYLELSNFGLSDMDIKRMYKISTNVFQFFKSNHLKVLGGKI